MECLSYLNLGLLSALAAVFQNNGYNEEVVSIISVSVALATFIGLLLFHAYLRVKNNYMDMYQWFKKCAHAVKRDGSKGDEESESILDDDDDPYERLIQPTSSDIRYVHEAGVPNPILYLSIHKYVHFCGFFVTVKLRTHPP